MIKHIMCDIFESGADVICHQTNCQGVMGSGIAKQVREKYPQVYEQYKRVCASGEKLLGRTQIVPISPTQSIANLFGQDNYGYTSSCYTDYDALLNCLKQVRAFCPGKTIAVPFLLGCARGGGDWSIVSNIINEVFDDYDGDVLICECDKG